MRLGLKFTGVKLEIIKDYDIVLFLNRAMKGGVSFVGHNYANTNQPGTKGYCPQNPETTIINTDATNLYGYSMSQVLPTDGFAWEESVSKFTPDFINQLEYKGPVGYYLEVSHFLFYFSFPIIFRLT